MSRLIPTTPGDVNASAPATPDFAVTSIGSVSGSTRWPNLFLVGAARAGSTALYDYLRQHPDIFMSPAKEPGFLAVDGELFDLEDRRISRPSYFVTTIDDYRALFRHHRSERIVGEATPHYLHDPRVPARIRHYSPDARIVVILRSPAARAFSAHMMGVRDGSEHRSFTQAMREAVEHPDYVPILRGGFYADAIESYHEAMGAEQVIVVEHSDLHRDPTDTMNAVFRKLGVHEHPVTTSRPSNRSGRPRSAVAHRMVSAALDHRVMKRVHLRGPRGLGHTMERARNAYLDRMLVHESISPDQERFYNRSIFGADIARTAELTSRDLSHWLAPWSSGPR